MPVDVEVHAAGGDDSEPETTQPGTSRRGLLRISSIVGAGTVAAACAPSAPPSGGTSPTLPLSPPGPGLPPTWPPGARADSKHVARRLTWGVTPSSAADIKRRGLIPWLDEQLDWRSIDDSHVAPMLTPWPRPTASPSAIKADKDWLVPMEMAVHETIRRVFSRRQLHEVMADFWFDHFNVDVNHYPARLHMPNYDHQVIRVHALGRFSDLLPAVACSEAMLFYLDQATSRADRGRTPNENFARELMELHTVGSDGGYNEDDVKAVAHLFTGWSVPNDTGAFTFRPDWHDPGPMTPSRRVLGWSRGSLTGEAAGRSFLKHLANHPVTAQRVCHKLARRIIGEQINPTDPVVGAAAKVFRNTGTDIAATVRSLVLSTEFAASAGAKIRRPAALVTQMARALDVKWSAPAKPDNLLWSLWSNLEQLGHANHSWPSPAGYPDVNGHWLSVGSLVSRWNLAVWFAFDGVPGMTFDARATMAWAKHDRWGEWLDALALSITGEPWPPEVRATVLTHYEVTDDTVFRPWDHWAAQPVTAVLLQTVGFQRS